MKRIITVVIVFLGVCFGITSITLPIAISAGLEGSNRDTPGPVDTLDAVLNHALKNKSISCAADSNPAIDNENTATILPDLYVQAMGKRCVTPYTICDIEAQPINYPCCCDDGTCGYVSQ